ncbi:hypothetical protein [Desulfosporosinus sp. SB140]|uniref:hypothetical protein n=1 Tax=Desulfosporosinus paludis TaxID=3115649 RepID=UPI00388DDBB2
MVPTVTTTISDKTVNTIVIGQTTPTLFPAAIPIFGPSFSENVSLTFTNASAVVLTVIIITKKNVFSFDISPNQVRTFIEHDVTEIDVESHASDQTFNYSLTYTLED